ncbi:polysaccharide lyase family 7 protein [Cellulophaga baltica]|uniref:polysaccharide lyase family 7 protein n=1 Tax=Cellulophaga TaxID=104264 RepID=UPI001C07C1B7|nr:MULTISPECIES: polysaccharide lyase family 7 protein [Cellulophaga]MBU2997323.1 polysaccharide lyase family 7 protein [Cellulophaga baltica]MDO6768721.1 polysaccharide lyase family 7 protein [Cellulophaga sp. 1_MG-2023]
MHKLLLNYTLKSVFIFIILIGFSCSSDSTITDEPVAEEVEDEEVVEQENTEDDSETETDTETTSSTIDFGDLVVETSWISGDKSDRDQFTANDIDNEEWMDVYETGNVMMTCLAPDGHRTELKEDTGDESSLNTFKEMSYTATLNTVPENGITVAQIHNRGGVNRPWIRVYVDDDSVLKIKETLTTPDESTSTYNTYVGPEYTAGDDYSVKITTQNGNATFVIVTNEITYTETLSPSNDWDNYTNNYYLKAGVYTEGDDIEPVLEMSSFSIAY